MKRKIEVYEDNQLGIVAGNTLLSAESSYGVSWNQETDTYARVGSGDYTMIQKQMKRCVLNVNGTVNYYLLATDSTKKADGTDSVLDGTDGEVMVEIPKFYYGYSMVGDSHTWQISLLPFSGGSVHPAFSKDGVEVPYRYIGAYDANDAGSSKLGSRSGTYPHCSQTIADARTWAQNVGTGWGQHSWYVRHAIQVLMLIEYADFNSQEVIGMGRTELSGGTWADGSYYGQSGIQSNAIGNGTGCINYNGDADDAGADNAYMSYRGIENLWGNVYNFCDGINIKDYVPYLSKKPAGFASDTFDGDYVSTGVTMPSGNGYQGRLADNADGMFPVDVSGGTNTRIGDYYWQNSGNRIALVGTTAPNRASSGACALGAVWAPSDSSTTVGARLEY